MKPEVKADSQGRDNTEVSDHEEHEVISTPSDPGSSQAETGGGDTGEIVLVPEMIQEKEEAVVNVSRSCDVAVQTDDGRQQRERMANRERRYKRAIQRLYRKFLQIRRRCQAEMSGLRKADRETSEFLSRVQMSLPGLEREKQALLAELEAIEVQHEEEKRRNQDLVTRLQRRASGAVRSLHGGSV
nr:hypothetical protein BaRGS_020001 [Batillaria attramentaria]